MDEIKVGRTQVPEIPLLPDGEVSGKVELRSELTNTTPGEVGSVVTNYTRGLEAWWNSQLKGGEPPVELVLEPLFLEQGGGTVELGQVNILLRAKVGIGPAEFGDAVDGIEKATRQLIEANTARRMATSGPVLKVEV